MTGWDILGRRRRKGLWMARGSVLAPHLPVSRAQMTWPSFRASCAAPQRGTKSSPTGMWQG